jgi:hypothetical protein
MTTITIEIRKKSILKTVIAFLESVQLPFQIREESLAPRTIPPLEHLLQDADRYKNGDKAGFLEFENADAARKHFGL